jgi:CRP-like cAMP-binding protein
MTQIHLFQHASQTSHFAAGELIFQQGESGDVLYVITAGHVDIVDHGICIATLGVGELLGEMAFIDGEPRSAAAIARTACTLALIDRRNFQFLVDYTPHFSIKVMQTLSGRVRTRLPSILTAPATQCDHSA